MFTDRTALLTQAYADRGPLAARISIYQWQQDPVDLPGLAVAALADVRGLVLDAGCGLGTYAERVRADRPDLNVVALDLSVGMRPDLVGDVQALPLAESSCSGALAMHMLYHVPDIPAAVRELRRVLKAGGVLVVSTNGRDDKHELGQLFVDAVHDLTGTTIEAPRFAGRFTPDDSHLLQAAFDSVEVAVFERVTLVPQVQAVMAYVNSMRALRSELLPPGLGWEAFLDAVRTRVSAEIGGSGSWRLHNQVGVLTCR